MRLNLGCGQDIRQGYTNIDVIFGNKDIKYGDFKNLNACGILPNSVEEMLAINTIQYIRYPDLANVFLNWVDKLQIGGTIYIESLDSNMLGTVVTYDLKHIQEINNILYPVEKMPPCGIYSLMSIETFLLSNGCETVMKGLKDLSFYIQLKRVK